MSTLSSGVRRLQKQLESILIGCNPTTEEITSIRKQIPKLLRLALNDEHHLLAVQLVELKKLIADDQPSPVGEQKSKQNRSHELKSKQSNANEISPSDCQHHQGVSYNRKSWMAGN
jgi:hypothetical protein